MAVQVVEKWQAADGKVFNTEAEANRHEKYLEIHEVLSDSESVFEHDIARYYSFIIELLIYFEVNEILPPTADMFITGNFDDSSASFPRYIEAVNDNAGEGYEEMQHVFRFYRTVSGSEALIQTEETGTSSSYTFPIYEPGNYRVSMQLTNAHGLSDIDSSSFEVPPEQIEADFSTNSGWEVSGFPKTVIVTDDSSGPVVSWLWTLRRGEDVVETSTDSATSFTIEEAGEYEIMLTVTDENDNTDSTSTNFTITPEVNYFLTDLPNTVASFGFRRMRSTFEGPLIRARRSSDNSEMDFYPNDDSWIDTGDVRGWGAGSTVRVVTFYDQSGNGLHATLDAGMTGPIIVDSNEFITISERPAAWFGSMSGFIVETLPLNIQRTLYFVGETLDDYASRIFTVLSGDAFNLTSTTAWAGPVDTGTSLGDVTANKFWHYSIEQTNSLSTFRHYGGFNNTTTRNSGTVISDVVLGATTEGNGFNGYLSEFHIWQGDVMTNYLSTINARLGEIYTFDADA